ncbi:Superoxide dismutase [Mn], mitochondrial [Vitis vinifera]|uniref:superoxide dismutase n=2 Tax=Vitis vinifera TaxID=29760 RepID=A0A438E3L3_VITVI|nr:Superoxide dismutase [Mn], mitochondrial [Vitis vinifera]
MGWFQFGPKQAQQVKISGLGLKFKGTPEKPRPASPTVKFSPFVHCRRHTRLLQSSMALRTLITRKSLGLGLGVSQSVRGLQTVSLPDLPYDYGALEPAISGEIMKLHHQKHHQTYITNYNKALEQLHEAMEKGDSSTVVKLQGAIKFNGGGHVNHSIFWKNLTPVHEGGGEPPKGSLGWAIDTHFGSMEALVAKINSEGAAVQGSGWVWLGLDKDLKKLVVETTANQDPLVTKGPNLVPLLGIDVWEHAYYLQYKNVRPDYLKNVWKVIDWKYASEVYEKECP